MRFVVIIVAALVIVGLAAFGLVSAQKGATPTSTAASTVRVASATQNVPAPPVRTPVSQIAQATGSEAAVSAATTPSRPPQHRRRPRRPASPRRRLLRPLQRLERLRRTHPARTTRPAIFRHATSRAGWVFHASSRSTPPTAPASALSTSSSTTSSATRRSF